MSYWKNQKQRLEKELEGLNDLLGEWRTELSIASNPNRKRTCRIKIQELEERISKYEADLESIEYRLANNIAQNTAILREVPTTVLQNIINQNEEDYGSKESNNNRPSPYRFGIVSKRYHGKGSTYIVTDQKGDEFHCTYADLLTEGFRTLREGDKVRFVSEKGQQGQMLAKYILKINEEEDFFDIEVKNIAMEIKDHYDRLSSIYDDLWTYSKEFVDDVSKQICSSLELEKNDVLVDYGCGTGIYTKAIKNIVPLNNDIICTDISAKMLDSLRDIPGFQVVETDAISFSKLDMKYDKVFIKEMIHHIKEGREIIYRNIYNNLSSGGIFIILLLPPTIEYPLFSKALKYYEENQPHYSEIESGFKDAGFKTSIEFIKFPLKIEKNKYFKMVRNRYMSLLSMFSDDEIEDGIREMNSKYKKQEFLQFNDIFVVVKGQKV